MLELMGFPRQVWPLRPVSTGLMRKATALSSRLLPLFLQPEDIQPSADQMQFDAVVWFTHPVAGRQQVSTGEKGDERLFAENAASAARKWLWRLSIEEHAAVDRLTVRPRGPHARRPVSDGPTFVFRREGTTLVEIERRDDTAVER
jgi:hypothetical protein